MKKYLFFTLLFMTVGVFAGDAGFRFTNGKCVDSTGKEGLNPSYFGQCADFRGAVLGRLNLDGIDFSGSQFSSVDLQKSSFKKSIFKNVNFDGSNLAGVDFSEAVFDTTSFKQAILKNVVLTLSSVTKSDFTDADLRGTQLSQLQANSCNFTRAVLTGSDLTGARVGLSDFSGADLSSGILQSTDFSGATLNGAKLSNANLLKANLNKVIASKVSFYGATLTGAQLKGAQLALSDFRNSKLDNSDLTESSIEGTDLRGANLSQAKIAKAVVKKALFNKRTLLPISKEEAESLGMVFKATITVFILWDVQGPGLTAFADALRKADFEVTLSKVPEYQFTGAEPLTNYETVIQFSGQSYSSDIALAGQKAIVDFINAGGNFIYGEWNAYREGAGFQKMLTDVTLMTRNSGGQGPYTMSATADMKNSPLFEGLTLPITFQAGYSFTKMKAFATNPAQVVMKDGGGNDAMAIRRLGKGRVIAFGFACSYIAGCMTDANVQKLYMNAASFER